MLTPIPVIEHRRVYAHMSTKVHVSVFSVVYAVYSSVNCMQHSILVEILSVHASIWCVVMSNT